MSHLDPAVLHRLRRRRVEIGLSQRELAARMGTTQSAISDLETGRHDPAISTLNRWAATLGLRATVDLTVADLGQVAA